MKLPLSNGMEALVDDDRGDLLQYRWHLANGYARRQVWKDRKFVRNVYLHHEVSGPGETDHINGDRLDCRSCNLRKISHKENCLNREGMLGIDIHQGRFRARISGEHLGSFDTEEEAQTARLARERELWGIQPRRAALHE